MMKPVTLDDRELITRVLQAYQPDISELTFTNLFIWQEHYNFVWDFFGDWLVIGGRAPDGKRWALPPVGPPGRGKVVREVLEWLREEGGSPHSAIERADRRLIEELSRDESFVVEPMREHFDYLYRTEDLIALSGRKYHGKKNHLNAFQHSYHAHFEVLGNEHLARSLALADAWCRFKRCKDDLGLQGEWKAVKKCLTHYQELSLMGGVLIVDGEVQAFSVGEPLTKDTVVVHFEKANPAIRGIYVAINQQCCERLWAAFPFVNREQDLDNEGLRRAKLSYHPVSLVEKFRVTLALY